MTWHPRVRAPGVGAEPQTALRNEDRRPCADRRRQRWDSTEANEGDGEMPTTVPVRPVDERAMVPGGKELAAAMRVAARKAQYHADLVAEAELHARVAARLKNLRESLAA
jgi:hypothetical protein